MTYWKELLFWVTLATGVALFTAGFIPLFKLASTKVPVAGLREALAS